MLKSPVRENRTQGSVRGRSGNWLVYLDSVPNMFSRLSFLIFLLMLFAGCATTSPHENFKAHLYQKVGMSLDEIPPYWWPYEEDLIDSNVLANGNLRNRYKYRGTCVYIYEINPQTRIIVDAGFEGKETDCIVNP